MLSVLCGSKTKMACFQTSAVVFKVLCSAIAIFYKSNLLRWRSGPPFVLPQTRKIALAPINWSGFIGVFTTVSAHFSRIPPREVAPSGGGVMSKSSDGTTNHESNRYVKFIHLRLYIIFELHFWGVKDGVVYLRLELGTSARQRLIVFQISKFRKVPVLSVSILVGAGVLVLFIKISYGLENDF